MQALKIVTDVNPKYVHADEDRQFLQVGQKLTGYVQLDRPGKPKSCEIRWLDSRGRLLGRTAGAHDAYNRRMKFEFDLDQNLFWVHSIECDIDGQRQAATASFFVAPDSQGWESFPAITWASYPTGDFFDKLQEVGVNGHIAYKMSPFEAVVENAMRFYVDQCTFDEISTYHRPFKQFWEPPADRSGPTQPAAYRENWRLLLDRYARVLARAKKEGRMISRDEHYRKMLWRAYCPNDPGTVRVAGDRFRAVVRQHKGFRPLFQNIADEAGITDQTQPFDFCYCPFCIDKFRLKMLAKYGTLAELNRQWDTDFTNLADVYPLTCDETMDAQRKAAPLNFASWADHRDFMDDSFAEFFAQMRQVGREVDPYGTFSQGGCQWPTIYGGWDYAKVVRTVDAIIPYNIGGNQEIIRSIQPELKCLSPFFGDHERQIRQMWYAYLHGDAGIIFWDFDEPNGRFVERPSGKLSKRGKLFGPPLREMRNGYAQLFKAWNRVDDPIGLLYSQPAERAHWMLESIDDRGKKEWFNRVYVGRYVNVRQSWQRLIEDRQLQYRYLSYLAIDEGAVDLSAYKMIILPEALALSDAQARALRQFVHNGGVLVADGRCGRMTENCRQRQAGVLDDLFGVHSGGRIELKAGRKVSPKRQSWMGLDADLGNWHVQEPGLRLIEGSTAEPAAAAGAAPAIVRRKVGAGWAVYLNLDLADYEDLRYQLDKPHAEAVRKVLDGLLSLAGITPAVRVKEHTLGTTCGLEVTRFARECGELAAVLPNRMWRASGIGEALPDEVQDAFELDRKVTATFDRPQHTWDSRTGHYFGNVATVDATAPRLTPLILARLPYRVAGLNVQAPQSVNCGQKVALDISLAVEPQAEQPVEHVFRVDVYTPDGDWAHWYSKVLNAPAGHAAMAIPLALNDAVGSWRVAVRDIVTGATAERKIRVTR